MECCGNFHDSCGDLRNWYVHELLKTMCLVNVGLKDHLINLFSSSVSFSVFSESLSLVLRWIKSQIWTVLTAARELWVLVAGVSVKRAD